MQIEYLIILLQLIVIGLLIFRREKNDEKAILQEELSKMSKELSQALGESRRESTDNLTSQFRLIFDNLRATSKDQNEALRSFGEIFRANVQDFNILQREKFGELNRRQEELMKSSKKRLKHGLDNLLKW